MKTDLPPEWRRWVAAESDGRDDEADAALRTVFRAVPPRMPPDGFGERVAQAVARTAARQARLAKAVYAAGGAIAAALTIALVWQLPRLVRAGIDLSVNAVVWIIIAVDRGLSVWAILAQMARTLGALVVAPQVTMGLVALGLIAILALYALNRMLELEERSSP